MGQKNSKGSVSIMNANDRIRLRWRYLGKRYSLNLFKYCKQNLVEAKRIALLLEQDLITQNFDFTLSKYGPQITVIKGENKQIAAEHFRTWAIQYKQIDFDRNVHYNGLYMMLKRWGDIRPQKVLDKLNNTCLGNYTYNERLRMLKSFYNWMVKQKYVSFNPLEDVVSKTGRNRNIPKRKPFSAEDITRVLTAFKNDLFSAPGCHFKHSHYYPFMYFIFSTGVRNAEAIGLRVNHIKLDKEIIEIREVLARSLKGSHANARVRKETKNGKIRQIPISVGLKEVLTPLLIDKDHDNLVFVSPTGLAIDDRMFQRRIFKPILKELGLEDRDLYACRHTFSSRCIEAGLTPVMTAFLMGNNPETVLRSYTHQMGLPPTLPKIREIVENRK